MVFRSFMVGNDHLFGRGTCVEQTHRLCWRTSRHERKAIPSDRHRRHAAQLSMSAFAVVTGAM
jgi:hypothetical protein